MRVQLHMDTSANVSAGADRGTIAGAQHFQMNEPRRVTWSAEIPRRGRWRQKDAVASVGDESASEGSQDWFNENRDFGATEEEGDEDEEDEPVPAKTRPTHMDADFDR